MHETLVEGMLGDALIGHVSRDLRAGRSRHRSAHAAGTAGGEEKPIQPGRLERQVNMMDPDEMLDDLPKVCDQGAKKNLSTTQARFNLSSRSGIGGVLNPTEASLGIRLVN